MAIFGTMDIGLEKAIAKLGSQSALARAIGVSQPSVWKWVRDGKPIPAERVPAVSNATGIPLHELRPDIFPAPVAA